MQGGLFGLSPAQKTYLYIAQLIPMLIVHFNSNLILIFALLQFFYFFAPLIYIKFLSMEKQFYPYFFYQNNQVEKQRSKGFSLAVSGFLLVVIYGIFFLKIGRIALPHTIEVGQLVLDNIWALIILLMINAFLEEWFWRLFQPKSIQNHSWKDWINFGMYLLFHLMLFFKYFNIWRAIPLLTLMFSFGRSMNHIKIKFGFWAAVITHYGITFAGLTLYLYVKWFTDVKIV